MTIEISWENFKAWWWKIMKRKWSIWQIFWTNISRQMTSKYLIFDLENWEYKEITLDKGDTGTNWATGSGSSDLCWLKKRRRGGKRLVNQYHCKINIHSSFGLLALIFWQLLSLIHTFLLINDFYWFLLLPLIINIRDCPLFDHLLIYLLPNLLCCPHNHLTEITTFHLLFQWIL